MANELSKDMHRLAWGYNAGLPERFLAAWGARCIYNGDGLDVVPDRTDVLGDPAMVGQLAARLGSSGWREAITKMDRQPRPSQAEEFTVYESDGLTVKVNTHASYGYLYVVAYLPA